MLGNRRTWHPSSSRLPPICSPVVESLEPLRRQSLLTVSQTPLRRFFSSFYNSPFLLFTILLRYQPVSSSRGSYFKNTHSPLSREYLRQSPRALNFHSILRILTAPASPAGTYPPPALPA